MQWIIIILESKLTSLLDITVTRNSRAEQKASTAFQQQQEAQMEKLCSQIQKEMATKMRTRSQKRISVLTPESIAAITSPEELCSVLESAPDPGNIEVINCSGVDFETTGSKSTQLTIY